MFTVQHDDIKDFTGDELVELLRRLLYAEARKADVPLRGVHVPLQITVADGGVDGSIIWTDGAASTDYFPGRDIIFQCKAKDRGNVQWEQEVWTKPTQAKTVSAKVLNNAVKDVLARGGSYVGVTTSSLVGSKPADRVAAIKKGISTAGGNPAQLAAVEVYEGNKLPAWASAHPGVAVWVKQRKAAIELAGFSTIEQWGKRADIVAPTFVDCPDRKFSLGPRDKDAIDFSQLAARLADALDEPGRAARIWGASGIGKTRALYHALSTSPGLLSGLTAANFIFCDYREVPTRLFDVANQIVKERSGAVLVVDGCPHDKARQLNEIARAADSKLRVVTIGPDGIDQDHDCVMIRPTQADQATIRSILKAGLPKAKPDELDYLAEFCDGYPRIAVSATESYEDAGIRKSADAVAQQILEGVGAERETVRALECLSLFTQLSPDEYPDEFDKIAETLVHMKGELMYENLVIAARQHLVGRNYGAMNAQPRPIADFLALRRLDALRPSTVIGFLDRAMPHHRDAMLARWRFLARSQTLSDVIHTILRGPFAEAKIVDPDVAPYLPAFVHVEPDRTGSALYWTIGRMPLDDLAAIPVTDQLIYALRLLTSRENSFAPAAQMVLRLAAVAETEEGPPPIVKLLRQLFQVIWAGTQVDDRRRRDALEEALDEDDPRIRRAGVEALGAMIQVHISRSDEFEQVGAEPFRSEWRPEDNETIPNYFDWALQRLLDVWRKDPELRPAIEKHVADDLRGLLMPKLLPAIDAFVREVVKTTGSYFQATNSIGDWLYYDRPARPTKFSRAVQALYDATVPTDPVDQVRLHSRFWMADIHAPGARYATDKDNLDFEYSARCVQALAPGIARDPEQLGRAITAMATEEMNAPGAFAHALAPELNDPIGSFERAVAVLDASGSRAGVNFVGSLLGAIDRRLQDQPEEVEKMVSIATNSTTLAADPMQIRVWLRVTDARLDELTQDVNAGKVTPARAVVISYGRGLESVSLEALGRFITALTARGDDGGPLAAIEILSMVTHGQKDVAPGILALARPAILSPSIGLGDDDFNSHADYTYDRMLRMLDAADQIDGDFAHAFAVQIEQACRTTGAGHGRPSDALRKALSIVIKRAPEEVWPVLAGFYDIATRVERERLNSIVSATKLFAYEVSRTGSGPLFETPRALMLDWVAGAPDGRIGFLVSFFPILEQKDDEWTWHPTLQQLAKLYGRSKRFKDALRSRIYPSSWGGSLNPHLTSFKAPLASWTKDRVLGGWASKMLDDVERSLASNFYGR